MFTSLPIALGLLGLAPSAMARPTNESCHAEAKMGAVASGNAPCSKIGADIIKNGGNAADSMIATTLCAGVIGMYHSGIGGGGFMVVRSPEGEYEVIDFRETAPAASDEDMFSENEYLSMFGGLAIGVPGEIRGLEYLHKKYGSMEWEDLVMPAAKVATEGFTVTEDQYTYWNFVEPNNTFLTEDPNWAEDFAPEGKLLEVNSTMTRKRLGKTLATIAKEGPTAFYAGKIAESSIKTIKAAKGIVTLDDLKNYQVAIREPVQLNYRGVKLTTSGPPSSGGIALGVLNTLSGYENLGDDSQINQTTHRVDEAIKWGYSLRTQLGDPAFVEGLDAYTANIVSKELGNDIRSKIDDEQTFNISYYNPQGFESLDTPGTAHLVTADASGMSVSLTTTINLLFGSQVMDPNTGIIFNNEMNDFSIPESDNAFGYIPSPDNFIVPGKRPLSSITPIIAETEDGKFFFSIGAAGGSRIITSTIQNAMHIIDGEKHILEALAQPRFHDQLSPPEVEFERELFPNSTVAYMKELGHNVTWGITGMSIAQGLMQLPNGTFAAAGEPRQASSGGYAI